jgi:hypothetical protein
MNFALMSNAELPKFQDFFAVRCTLYAVRLNYWTDTPAGDILIWARKPNKKPFFLRRSGL